MSKATHSNSLTSGQYWEKVGNEIGKPLQGEGGQGLSPSLGLPQYEKHTDSSLTRATLTAGTLILNKDSQPIITTPEAIGINTHLNLANEQVEKMDLAKLKEQQELAKTFGQLGAMTVGELGQHFKLKDGSWQKVAMHTAVGAMTAAVGGGNVAAGATAGGVGEMVNTEIAKYLEEHTKLDKNTRNTIQSLTAGALGLASGQLVGGNRNAALLGGNIAETGEKYNRQLHPNEMKWIKENAGKFAEEQGISVEEAEKRLAQQASKGLDILWVLKLNAKSDDSARDFLARQSTKTFIDSHGDVQHYFVAKDNDFWTPRKYAGDAYRYMQSSGDEFYKRNLQTNTTVWQGFMDKVAQSYDYVSENKAEAAGMVVNSIAEGASSCVSDIGNCLKDTVYNLYTTGISSGAEMAKNLVLYEQDIINKLYGEDVEGAMAIVSSAQFAGVAAEALGLGKLVKVGSKTTVEGIGKAVDKGLDRLMTENLALGATIKLGHDKYTYLGDNIFEGPAGGKIINTGQVDPATGNTVYQRLNQKGSPQSEFLMISEDGRQITGVPRPENLPNLRVAEIAWQKSEADVAKLLGGGYSSQVSYLNGKEVPHGTPGSVRLDFSNKSDVAIEVKNYDIHSNRAALVSVVVKQAEERQKHLPDGMQQNIYIDLRGQSYDKLDKINIQNDIIKKSNNIIDANNIIFLEGK